MFVLVAVVEERVDSFTNLAFMRYTFRLATEQPKTITQLA